MDFLSTAIRRRILFTALYFAEGAPIGFIWWALPPRLENLGVAADRIGLLASMAALPWAFKFVWAPAIDVLRFPRWGLRHWIILSQFAMAATFSPLLFLDISSHFSAVLGLLIMHAFAAATQDVSIDALAIATVPPAERGRVNGWMQAGMWLGRSTLGGGLWVIVGGVDERILVASLLGCAAVSVFLLAGSREPPPLRPPDQGAAFSHFLTTLARAFTHRGTWLGLAFALTAGAAYEVAGLWAGPMLAARGVPESDVHFLRAGPGAACLVVGSLVGGWMADRWGRKRQIALYQIGIAGAVVWLGLVDLLGPHLSYRALLWPLGALHLGIGLFTAASYALFMDISRRGVAATQFSAFMGATNGCEAWTVFVAGLLVESGKFGYGGVFLAFCPVTLAVRGRVSFGRRWARQNRQVNGCECLSIVSDSV